MKHNNSRTQNEFYNLGLAISTLDGRYRRNVEELAPIVSEFGLFQRRVMVEIKYFIKISPIFGFDVTPFVSKLEDLYFNFSENDYGAIKAWEHKINHDVKAVEYWLREKFRQLGIPKRWLELIHLALTSEDVNNLAYSLQAHQAHLVLLSTLDEIHKLLSKLAIETADVVMLGRTHGQPATSTTFGKEIKVYKMRLMDASADLKTFNLSGKLSGATGTFAAQILAKPVDWVRLNTDFVKSLGLDYIKLTTQIEPHDRLCRMFDTYARINTIFIDLAQDMWLYIAFDLVNLRVRTKEVGSSTMPHKVNPIDFENAIGNLQIANSLLMCFSRTLPVSKLQRDLSDSTILRNIGVAFAYTLQAYKSLLRGLNKIQPNKKRMHSEVERHPEILAEAIQTVLRAEGIPNGYELLKDFTRGQAVTLSDLRELIESLPINEEAKERLRKLRPSTYIGLAKDLALE